MSLTGFPDRPPVVTGVNVGDAGTGMHLTIAILAALVQRQRTGRGQLVEVAMQEAVLNITRVKFTPTLTNGRPLERMGNRSASGAYADLVRCAGGGPNDYVYLMLPPDNAEPFEALVDAIGRQDVRSDERFSTPPARARHSDDLTAVIEGWTMKHDKHEVMRALASRGIPCGAVLDTAEVNVASLTMYRMNRTTIVRSPDANVSRPISRKTRSGLTSRRLATTPISPATRLGIPASTIAMVVCSAIQRPADFLARVIHVLSKDETACGGRSVQGAGRTTTA